MSFFKRIFSSDKKEQAISDEAKLSLDKGLEKSKTTFFSKLTKAVAGKSKVDDEVLDNLEEILVASDVGVNTTLKIIKRIEKRVAEDKYLGTNELHQILREEIAVLLSETNLGDATEFVIPLNVKPYVLMVVGVNGVGKTTTIGKLANQYKKQGYKVVLGAADTFRAAAIDQLQVWADRVGVPLINPVAELNERPFSIAGEIAKDAIVPPVEFIEKPLMAVAEVAFSVADESVKAGAIGAQIAYRVVLLAVVYGKVAPAAYEVPVPAEFVFQLLRTYPVRVNVFAGNAELVPERLGFIDPDPELALNSTIAPHCCVGPKS